MDYIFSIYQYVIQKKFLVSQVFHVIENIGKHKIEKLLYQSFSINKMLKDPHFANTNF